jgi:hypothetical protein
MQEEASKKASEFANGTKARGVKKPYTSPLLQVYGTVSQATKGSPGLLLDAQLLHQP